MCGGFVIAPEHDLKAVARAIEYDEPLNIKVAEPSETQLRALKMFPGRQCPVLLTSKEKLHPLRIKYLMWGFPFENRKGGAFNTRLETAAHVPMWRKSFEDRHCIVPVLSFDESSQSETTISKKTGKPIKQKYTFTNADSGLVLLAGIWKPDYFSLLTEDSRDAVNGVHDRMPVVVDLDGAKKWLFEGKLGFKSPVNLRGEKI